MFKRLKIKLLIILFAQNGIAQISPVHSLYQYSVSAFQPTAFPFNVLDKIKGAEWSDDGTDHTKQNWYTNLTTRLNWQQSLQSSSSSADGRLESSVFNLDYISNKTLGRSDKFPLCVKAGGGILHSRWEDAQITSPFAHVAIIFSLGTAGESGNWFKLNNWRLAIGGGVRLSNYSPCLKVTYQHPFDSDVQAYLKESQFSFTTFTASAAVLNVRGLYLGVGYNRMVNGFLKPTSALNSAKINLDELNLLAQFAWGVASEGRNSQKGVGTHHHTSLVMYQLMQGFTPAPYPLYWQANHRFSLGQFMWMGFGYNSANRVQLQGGFLKIPRAKSQREFQLWITTEMSSSLLSGLWKQEGAFKQGAIEANIGYFF